MEPMKGKWASSRDDLGYTELFCIPEVTAVFLSSCDSGPGDSLMPKHIEAPYVFLIEKMDLLCTQCRGFGPHLTPRGMSHGISRVVAGTWGIFSTYSGDGHSKLHFVQRSQDSCLVRTDTSGIKTRFGRIIQTLLAVRWETNHPFLVSTEILGFLSIFKKSQTSAPFEALNSMGLSRCQGCEANGPDEAGT